MDRRRSVGTGVGGGVGAGVRATVGAGVITADGDTAATTAIVGRAVGLDVGEAVGGADAATVEGSGLPLIEPIAARTRTMATPPITAVRFERRRPRGVGPADVRPDTGSACAPQPDGASVAAGASTTAGGAGQVGVDAESTSAGCEAEAEGEAVADAACPAAEPVSVSCSAECGSARANVS